jgi:hypothetical protein
VWALGITAFRGGGIGRVAVKGKASLEKFNSTKGVLY